MSSRTLLILTIVVAILGAFIFFVERDLPSTDERTELEKKLLELVTDDVRTIEIVRGDDRLRLERQAPPNHEDEKDDGKGDVFKGPEPEWRLTAPFDARADRAAIDSLLASLAGLEKKRTLDDYDPAGVGLDAPRGRVTLVTDTEETTIEIGLDLPTSSDMIVGVSGRAEAYRVAASIWDDLVQDPGAWRDKSLFPGDRLAIEAITLRAGEAAGTLPVVLRERGEAFWIERPIEDLADPALTNALLGDLATLEAVRFVDDPAELAADLNAEATIEIEVAGTSEPFLIELGAPEDTVPRDTAVGTSGNRVARVDGQLVVLESVFADALGRSPAAWRSRDWTTLQVFQIDRAVVTDAAGELEVRRVESDWLRGDEIVDFSTVSDALYAVAEAEAVEVLDRTAARDRGHALSEPRLTLTFDTEDGASETLRLYPIHDGHAVAEREGRDAVLLFSAETVDVVVESLEALRDAEALRDTVSAP